jgi:hypothetical protein
MSDLDQLKARVEALEQQMRDLRRPAGDAAGVPGWKRKIGLFAGDAAFAEILRHGAKARRADRPGAPAEARKARKPVAKRTA